MSFKWLLQLKKFIKNGFCVVCRQNILTAVSTSGCVQLPLGTGPKGCCQGKWPIQNIKIIPVPPFASTVATSRWVFGLSSAGQGSATPKRSLVFSFGNFTATGRAEQIDKNAMHFPQTDTLYAFTKVDKGCREMIHFISIANNMVSSLPNFWTESSNELGICNQESTHVTVHVL